MKDLRLEMRVSADFFADVDAWRRGQADIPARPEAIRRMVAEAAAAMRAKTIDKAPIAPPVAGAGVLGEAQKPARRRKASATKAFDKTAYQRDYMAKRRAAAKANGHVGTIVPPKGK